MKRLGFVHLHVRSSNVFFPSMTMVAPITPIQRQQKTFESSKAKSLLCTQASPRIFLESDSQNRFWDTIGSRVATIKFSFLHAVPGLGGRHTKSILGMQSWGQNYKWLSSKQQTNPARLTLALWHASTARIGHFTVKISPFFFIVSPIQQFNVWHQTCQNLLPVTKPQLCWTTELLSAQTMHNNSI